LPKLIPKNAHFEKKGTAQILEFPSLNLLHEIQAHTSNVYCLDFDPNGRYFALGGADALTTIWDCHDLMCIQSLAKLEYFGLFLVRRIFYLNSSIQLACSDD
jgi:WD40 repeat protein